MAKHKIALIPGDGIGKEVLPEGVRVLEAAARRFNFQLEFTEYDWSCDRYAKTGKMMPDDGMETLKQYESIFLGAVGWPGVPDHVSLWGLLIPIRREFDEYVNLRPVRLFEELLPHLKSVEMAGPPRLVETNFVGGYKALPIRFKKA